VPCIAVRERRWKDDHPATTDKSNNRANSVNTPLLRALCRPAWRRSTLPVPGLLFLFLPHQHIHASSSLGGEAGKTDTEDAAATPPITTRCAI